LTHRCAEARTIPRPTPSRRRFTAEADARRSGSTALTTALGRRGAESRRARSGRFPSCRRASTSDEAARPDAHGRAGFRDVVGGDEVVRDRRRVRVAAGVPSELERVRPEAGAEPDVVEGARCTEIVREALRSVFPATTRAARAVKARRRATVSRGAAIGAVGLDRRAF
jgi:hypothetical protein